MPIRIVIDLPTGERSYEVPDPMTYRELSTIKRATGLRAGEIGDALLAGDTDVVLALAVVASQRSGEPVSMDQLEDLTIGQIRVEGDEDEDPTQAAADDAGGESAAQTIPVDGGTPA